MDVVCVVFIYNSILQVVYQWMWFVLFLFIMVCYKWFISGCGVSLCCVLDSTQTLICYTHWQLLLVTVCSQALRLSWLQYAASHCASPGYSM